MKDDGELLGLAFSGTKLKERTMINGMRKNDD